MNAMMVHEHFTARTPNKTEKKTERKQNVLGDQENVTKHVFRVFLTYGTTVYA